MLAVFLPRKVKQRRPSVELKLPDSTSRRVPGTTLDLPKTRLAVPRGHSEEVSRGGPPHCTERVSAGRGRELQVSSHGSRGRSKGHRREGREGAGAGF